jgi:hypothetical protein
MASIKADRRERTASFFVRRSAQRDDGLRILHGVITAIDQEVCSRHEAGCIAGKELRRARDLDRLPDPV